MRVHPAQARCRNRLHVQMMSGVGSVLGEWDLVRGAARPQLVSGTRTCRLPQARVLAEAPGGFTVMQGTRLKNPTSPNPPTCCSGSSEGGASGRMVAPSST